MKRTAYCLLFAAVFLLACAKTEAPTPKTEAPTPKTEAPAAAAEAPAVQSIAEKIDTDRAVRLAIPDRFEEAAAYDEPWRRLYRRCEGVFPTDGTDAAVRIEPSKKDGYLIDGAQYLPLPESGEAGMMLDGDEYAKRAFKWTVDCAFLAYVGTDGAYRVYALASDPDREVLVLKSDAEELLLARADSPLRDPALYRTEDFGACTIDGMYYTYTSVFPNLIGEITAPKKPHASMPSETVFCNFVPFTFESARLSGLSLTVNVIAYPNGERYVYNQSTKWFTAVTDPMDFNLFLLIREPAYRTESLPMDGGVLAARVPRYDTHLSYPRWSGRQPGFIGEYIFNWEANAKIVVTREGDMYRIGGSIFAPVPVASEEQAGWKVDLRFFIRFADDEADRNTALLTAYPDDKLRLLRETVLISTEDETASGYENILLARPGSDLLSDSVPDAADCGLCWVNNGIVLPAADAAALLPMLTDRTDETDVPVRFESTRYAGLYYGGWLPRERYEALFASGA